MNGKGKIIEAILGDADAKCADVKAAAAAKAESVISATEERIAADKQALEQRLAAASEEILRNKLANAALDARKYKLQRRQELIASCYDEAAKQLTSDDKKYRKFVEDLINKYAEKGEKVSIVKKDAQFITQKYLDSFGKGLVLSGSYVSAKGGIVLEGEGYDKNLTVEALVEYVRADTEALVAEALFGEEK